MSKLIESSKKYEKIGLIARELVEGFITGLHRSPYHGFSVEFAEHKLYNHGDSTRHIDWKVYAKTDRLYTKQYEEETNLRCQIILDNSSSMHYPIKDKKKLEFSIFATSALSYLLVKQRDAVGISIFSDKIEFESPTKATRTNLNTILTKLSTLPQQTPNKATDIIDVIHRVSNKLHKRSLIIIFSDMFQERKNPDELLKALQHLKYNKNEVILFHVADYQSELAFNFENRPYKFIDIESGKSIRINPDEVKKSYATHSRRFFEDLRIKCGSMKIDFVPVDCNLDYDKVLSSFLVKRTKMN